MQNNPLTEIILGVLAVFFIVGAVFLLYVGKIDFAGATLMFGFPAALFGINQALKAPSPSQQSQLMAQHQSLQDLMSQVLAALPTLFQQASTPPPVVVNNQIPAQAPVATQPTQPAPVAQPQVPQQPFPAKQSTFEMPVVPVQP